MRFRYKRIFCFFLIPLAFLLMQLAQANPSWVETVYSSRFYSVLSQGVSNVTGLLPFSMAETLLWLLAFAALAAICYGVYVFLWCSAASITTAIPSPILPNWTSSPVRRRSWPRPPAIS